MGWFDSVCDSIDEFSRALDRGKAWRETCNKNGMNAWTGECKDSPSQIKPGSVIRHPRGNYDHYGIYAGSEMVIHFSDDEIKYSGLLAFTNNTGDDIEVMGFNDEALSKYTQAQSLARAKRYLGKTDYSLFSNNCEHFALWCRTGEAVSTQAFGSKSSDYGAALYINVRMISDMFSSKLGMRVSRKVFIK